MSSSLRFYSESNAERIEFESIFCCYIRTVYFSVLVEFRVGSMEMLSRVCLSHCLQPFFGIHLHKSSVFDSCSSIIPYTQFPWMIFQSVNGNVYMKHICISKNGRGQPFFPLSFYLVGCSKFLFKVEENMILWMNQISCDTQTQSISNSYQKLNCTWWIKVRLLLACSLQGQNNLSACDDIFE